MNCDGLLIWRAACLNCGDEFEVDTLLNPYPKGLDCPTCRKRKLPKIGRLQFSTDALVFSNSEVEDILEGPIDEPT